MIGHGANVVNAFAGVTALYLSLWMKPRHHHVKTPYNTRLFSALPDLQ
jgi:hypothetical protein